MKIRGIRIRGALGLNKPRNFKPFSVKPIITKAKLDAKANVKVTLN